MIIQKVIKHLKRFVIHSNYLKKVLKIFLGERERITLVLFQYRGLGQIERMGFVRKENFRVYFLATYSLSHK